MRAAIESKKPWIGFNIDDAIGTPLIPAGMLKLEPHPYSEFRIQIDSVKDTDKLHRLIYASFEKTINDRVRISEGEFALKPE